MAQAIDMKKWQKMLRSWQGETPTVVAHILNSTTLQIDRERRKTLEQHFNFRSSGTKKYVLGDGTPNNRRSTLFFYPAQAKGKKLSQINVIIGAKKSRFNLDLWDDGGTIRAKEQNPHFTAKARGGSYRKLPKRAYRLQHGTKLPELKRNMPTRNRFYLLRKFAKSGQPFYASSQTVAGKKRQAGIYIIQQGRMMMLRGIERKDIKIPRTRWHSGAVDRITQGGKMHKIILAELNKLYKKKRQ
ncbi:hypothetical protein PVA45_08330 (plasmid) [Entomospira entomophila]|uniref:Uncharacterized protein n=1 Tax=Entomospira entomophila TaxID=2719988 RepID=A0A968KX63_9SPIO|nr:hypothetical protein [Entomospira entomophilus]NIZ41535.1 hypothetical protein [Entomospira entomophilus]WDI36437.1 hypothetical protein PVA45_08330 [Entomospira entomophilus]